VGGLLAAVKKSKRDMFTQSQSDSAQEELGDALWYLNALASRAELTLEAVGTATIVELRRHLKIGDTERTEHPTTFDHIDGLLAFQNEQIPEPKDVLLYRLAANTGNLFIEYDDSTKNLASPAVLDQLAQLFAGLAMVAAKFGLKLSLIAHANLQKIESRWPSHPEYLPFFDKKSKKHEQLPREFSIRFIEREVGGKKFVVQQLSGVNIGDPLTDNRLNGDDYRFHDVFHLAYIAHLGWSPVIRGLLKVKRKSEPKVDENEDGARAMIIEEGIATWIFNHARSRDFFEGIKEGKLEYGVLKQVQDIVSGYEVDRCPLWQWEKAIVDGFEVFRQLRDQKAGIVNVNMIEHTIKFEASPKEPA